VPTCNPYIGHFKLVAPLTDYIQWIYWIRKGERLCRSVLQDVCVSCKALLAFAPAVTPGINIWADTLQEQRAESLKRR